MPEYALCLLHPPSLFPEVHQPQLNHQSGAMGEKKEEISLSLIRGLPWRWGLGVEFGIAFYLEWGKQAEYLQGNHFPKKAALEVETLHFGDAHSAATCLRE